MKQLRFFFFFSLCFVLFSERRKEIYHLAMVIYPPRSWCIIPIRPKTYFPKLVLIEREREREICELPLHRD